LRARYPTSTRSTTCSSGFSRWDSSWSPSGGCRTSAKAGSGRQL